LKTITKISMAGLLVVLTAGPAFPQNRDILQLQKDMIDVMQIVKQLQTTVDRDDALIKGLVEKTNDQVNTLAIGMQKITETLDGLKNQNDASVKEMRTILNALNGTVKDLQGDLSSARAQIGSVSRELTTLKTTTEPIEGPDDLWRKAHADYSAGNWTLAIGGLQDFLSKFPEDPRAADAQLRIGDSLYGLKKYEPAVAQYDIVLQKYPESDTSRSALLKKGLAQAELNPQQAITTLNEVVKKYPNTSESQSAQVKIKELQPARPKPPAR
jgi:tol-pal system protein YbgF